MTEPTAAMRIYTRLLAIFEEELLALKEAGAAGLSDAEKAYFERPVKEAEQAALGLGLDGQMFVSLRFNARNAAHHVLDCAGLL